MSTYTPIASQTLASAAASVTFSSIPQGYTDLILIVNGINSSGGSDACVVQLGNGSIDAGSNYSTTFLYGVGSGSGSSGRQANANFMQLTRSNSANQTTSIIQIQNYSNTTTYKTCLSRSNDSSAFVWSAVGLWRSTSAINTLKFYNDGGGNFAAGSTFSIYGIQVGNAAQKAQGGNIVTSDGTYVYHAFTSSGSFIPNQAITADVLVVAGGGAGTGGGGGAGGVIAFASESLTTQNYVCTIGAGGTKATSSYFDATNGVNSQFGSLTAAVGGGKGGYGPTQLGSSGGSGGGAMADGGSLLTGSAGTSGQGNAGGNGQASTVGGAGGGGAGAAGNNNSGTSGGNGGAGTNTVTNWGALSAVLTSTGLGLSGYIAGGGGGGTNAATPGAGGSGGGGGGGNFGDSVAGKMNTGSGSGGIYNNYPTAAGGSGLIIIRYLA